MPFADCFRSGRFAVALEITPPLRPRPAVLLRRARFIGDCAQAINVIQRPSRQSSLDASIALWEAGIEPVWHLAVRGRSPADLAGDIARAAEGGIRNVLCLRGDHVAADLPETPSIREMVQMVVSGIPGALVGATLNQYAPDHGAVLRNLVPKLRAGASYAQTQPVFTVAALLPLAERLRAASPETRIVAMVMPLLSVDSLVRFESRLGIALGDSVRARIEAGEASAWEFFRETVAGLVASPLVDGVAIMTFEQDAPAPVGERIAAVLRATGALG
ncbi:MAG TPA: methylenetetrahydrofolate reductase [Tepidiformaceae bacterium]